MAYAPSDALRVSPAGGKQVTSGSSSAVTTLPNDSSGTRARFVRVSIATADGFAYVLPCLSGGSVTAGTGLTVAWQESVVLAVGGFTHLAYLEGSTAPVVSITPLEN